MDCTALLLCVEQCVLLLLLFSNLTFTNDMLIVTGDKNGDLGLVYKITMASPITVEDLGIDFRNAEHGTPNSVAFKDSKIYWSDPQTDLMARNSFVSHNWAEKLPLESGYVVPWQSPYGIAIDPVSELIYYTDNGLRHIAVTSLEGHTKKILIQHTSIYVNDPRAIAIDYNEGYMFWVEHPNEINKAQMNGDTISTLYTNFAERIIGLETDMREKRLYWCDESGKVLNSMDYDGGNVLIAAVRFTTAGTHCKDITIDQFNVYVIQHDSNTNVDSVVYFEKSNLLYSQRESIDEFSSQIKLNGIVMKNHNHPTVDMNGCGTNNGGCYDAFCVSLPNTLKRCVCPEIGCPLYTNNGGSDDGGGGGDGGGNGNGGSDATTEATTRDTSGSESEGSTVHCNNTVLFLLTAFCVLARFV